MSRLISFLLDFVKNILSPPCCYYCQKKLYQRMIFCDDCFQKIKPTVPYKLSISATKHVWVHALSLYDEPLKSLILQKRNKNSIGCYALAELLWERSIFRHVPCDVVVPIPLHWMRYVKRGFNQAEEMGKTLAKKRGITCVSLLKRRHYTSYQSDLPIEKREENVKNVFIIKKFTEYYKDKDIVLIDDLMTTGNTIKYAVKELFKLKPRSVNVIVACRARL